MSIHPLKLLKKSPIANIPALNLKQQKK